MYIFNMNTIGYILCLIVLTKSEPLGRFNLSQDDGKTRRILNGLRVTDTRRYMVYLRPAAQANPLVKETNWLCGGVIVHERYILTSAACIEDARNFYVVSGTYRWHSINDDDECIKNGAKKAVWKCLSKNYIFDGTEFDNFRWISGDIAVVKVEDEFNFEKRVRGCDYIPTKIPFNNVSREYEKPGTVGSIAGWGSTDRFGDIILRRKFTNTPSDEALRKILASPVKTMNSPYLLETNVRVISLKSCKKHWEPRYHMMMDEGIICTKDNQDDTMSADCIERGVDCKELEYSKEYDFYFDSEFEKKVKTRRFVMDPSKLTIHEASHSAFNGTRRNTVTTNYGGFCENDHGGPFIVGDGHSSMVVGIMAACLTKEITKKCYGPFLYTSIWHYRHLISCAIDKDLGHMSTCRKSLESENFRIEEVTFDWTNHPDGPAKTEIHLAVETDLGGTQQ